MHTEGFVGAFDPHRHIHPALHHRVGFIFLAELGIGGFLPDHGLELGGLTAHHRDQFGETVGIAVGNVEHAGHILQHRLGGHAVEGDDLRHLVVAVALGHVVDHLAPTLDAEVGVNIRHRFAFRVEEPLEQQAIAHRVDVGDPQAVSHQGTGR